VLLVATGNVLPKQLPPLNTLRYDPAERQAVQRFAGWSLVIVGALFTTAWATLPLSVAGVTAIGIGVAGLVLIGWRTRRGGRVPPAHS